MSDTNGKGDTRLDRLEASHVKLMTDHEVFWAHHQEFVARHDAWVAEQERAWERQERAWARQKERDEALDKRIADLVSAIGALVPRG